MNSMAVLGGSYDYRVPVLSLSAAVVAFGAALFVMRWARASQKGGLSAARERELYFQTLAEAVPEIIWTADPNGMDDFFNQKCFDYTGLPLEQLRGLGWQTIIHADDLEGCASKWKDALHTGAPYDVEYRLRGKDGTTAGSYAGPIPSGIPPERLSNGSGVVPISRIRNTTSRFWRSRFWNGQCN